MFELEKTETVKELIAITKSDSGISGPELAKAHMELGRLLAEQMPKFDPEDTTIVAMMRGGIFFAEGMYFSMGCKFQTYDPKHEEFKRPDTKNIIIVDSVINTGKTILDILTPDMYVACCVINEKAVLTFDGDADNALKVDDTGTGFTLTGDDAALFASASSVTVIVQVDGSSSAEFPLKTAS